MIQRPFASNLVVCVVFALTATMPGVALAEPPPAVDVVIHDEPPPRRIVTIEYNPLLLIIRKFSANIVVAPIDHHALVLSPFYFSTETAPIYVFDEAGTATQLPKQKFEGFGGELGYRYYFGERGPRGFFLGPSGILSAVKATAQNGSLTHFRTYGAAVDVGYQMLVADRVSLSLGAGVQYTKTSQSIPNQQFPSNFNANGGLRPRFLVSLGFAF
jgi:Protein of unknown function (DUF3575)